MSCFWGKPAQAFTLIEILVVIVILSILMALLVPAAKGILEKSQQSKCVSNLRAIAAANSMFMAETGTVPRYLKKSDPEVSWMMAITPYLGITVTPSPQTNTLALLRSVGWCPVESKSLMQATPGVLSHSYGWNAYIAGPVPGQQPLVGYFEKLSKMFLIGDRKVSVNYANSAAAWNGDVSNSTFSDRHQGICNVAFVDGHVESHALTNLPYRSLTNNAPAAQSAAYNAFWHGQ